MAKKLWEFSHGGRRTVAFDNGVQLSGGNKSITTILGIIDKIGKVLQKEDKKKCSTTRTRSNTTAYSQTRKAKHSPALAAKAGRARQK